GDDGDLLGDQVHAVADRVDQRHVRQAVRGQRAGEVVLDVEDHRGPALRAVRRVDLRGQGLHRRRVVPVDGEVLAGGVGEGDVDDALAPLGAGVQQCAVRVQAAHDVL